MAAGGAVGAGSIAGFRGSLFGGTTKRKVQKTRFPRFTVVRFSSTKPGMLKKNPLVKEDADGKFDQADVISKLKASEKRNELDKDAVAFGMENEDGQIVKVFVRAEQAEDFEDALAHALGAEDDDENETNTALEIAEVLFKLRDKFDIINVEWPEIAGDEEEEVEGPEGAEVPPEGAEGQPPEGEQPVEQPPEEDVKGTLAAVIDMMKADAEAKKAEAESKKAEADAKIADANTKAAEAKVKQEEEVLDMETYYDDKADKDKEAKQLAKLAKWRHDLSKDKTDKLPAVEPTPEPTEEPVEMAPEEEEEETQKIGAIPKSISRERFVDFLRAHIKAQK